MSLFTLLFPPRCILCRRLLPKGSPEVCSACQKSTFFSDTPPHKAKGAFYKCVYSALWYEGNVRKCLHRFQTADSFFHKRRLFPTGLRLLFEIFMGMVCHKTRHKQGRRGHQNHHQTDF